MNATVEKTEWLNRQQLEKLAEDKKNRVFSYTYENPERILPADEVKDLILAIRQRYKELKTEHPDWEDEKLRHHLCREKYRWKEFARTHALNFTHITDSTTDEAKVEYTLYMLYLKKQVEAGIITFEQSRAMVRDYFLQLSTKKTPKVKKAKKQV